MKSYDEMAREMDEIFESGKEMEGLVPVKARVSKNPRAVFSIRLGAEEFAQIAQASKSRGATMSDFIRLAALAAAREGIDLDSAAEGISLGDLKARLDALSEAIEKRLARPDSTKGSAA